jgi:hypothetical protein
VVPFDGRLLCATCIAKANGAPPALEKKTSQVPQILLGMAAVFLIWLAFYCFGWVVLQYRDTLPQDLAERRQAQSTIARRAARNQTGVAAPRDLLTDLRGSALWLTGFRATAPSSHGSVRD